MSSTSSRMSDSRDIWGRRAAPKVEIELDGQKPGLVSSYTTGDQIHGTVTVSVEHDTRFDDIEIIFQGISHTTVERAACPGRTGSKQMFLKLRQPIQPDEYPTPRVLETNQLYKFPFTFVVPDRLLPHVCTHETCNAQIHQSHTMLPPTLGDPMISGNGKTLLNDMAPDMVRIAYVIRASVLARSTTDNGRLKTLANVGKKIRIIPYTEEAPPIPILDNANYWLKKEKSVKRGFLRSKLGRMTASSTQPNPVQLLPPDCDQRVSTVANVKLRFDPVSDEQPPMLGSLVSRLRVNTFYSATPWEDFPSQSGSVPFSHIGQGLFTETVPLSTMCVASAKWKKHSTADVERRDSVDSTFSEASSQALSQGSTASSSTFYTASLVIPINLPDTKAFVPTFHTCLISRIYALDLSLSYHTPQANILTPTISLRLPIQITTPPKYANAVKTSLDVLVTEAELNEFFRPRSIAPLMHEAVVDVSPPPDYSETIVRPLPAFS
ncbi:hypothetical protein N7468_009670 [Penicillium chermesinum]|uniref:Arrestin-like N-terminal domain-containing protein n=1 Tax=Penicillium chermesinum TaxID=63820 RepID=A0A9W9NIJ3_9EURO|nr:uncharacterized protein N7468_009670 [Penicillium chermesinum]KAJ5220466.1 hypothetical protein N7468_009670 [Penicillium chermesinum]KAJ6157901.1 hypothetical protein N7470_005493 [Penicillium chermesinum]